MYTFRAGRKIIFHDNLSERGLHCCGLHEGACILPCGSRDTDLLVFFGKLDHGGNTGTRFCDPSEITLKSRIRSLPAKYLKKTIQREKLVFDIMPGDTGEEVEFPVRQKERIFCLFA